MTHLKASILRRTHRENVKVTLDNERRYIQHNAACIRANGP